MADNIDVTPGTGKTIAADDIGGVLFQRVKLALGADGTGVDASAGAGAVGTGVQRITLASDDPAVAQLTAGATAIAKAEDAASANADVGIPAMAIQKATPADTAGTDGDYAMLQMSAGRLWASAIITAAAASIGKAEDVASADADVGVPAMAIQKATPADTAGTDGDYAMLQMSAGRLWTSTVVPAAAASIAKAEDVASADADVGVPAMAVRKATPANTSGTDGDYEMLQMSAGRLWASAILEATEAVIGKTVVPFTTINTSVTRPADTTAYAVNDTWSDSTSAPTAGGFTFTNAARLSGGSGIITDAVITSSADPATTLQGEIWIFDQAGTNINDNAAFTMSDADVLNLVGVIPFTLASTVAGSGTNSFSHINGLNIGFTCVGTANLRFLVKVKNTYTPTSAEVLNVKLKIAQS